MSSVKALVTGAAGYSGSYFCRVLVSKGYTVHAFDIDESVREKAEGCVPFVGDIRNVTDLRVAAAGCSVIFHMGAVVPFGFVDAADEFLLRQVNVAGTKNVVEVRMMFLRSLVISLLIFCFFVVVVPSFVLLCLVCFFFVFFSCFHSYICYFHSLRVLSIGYHVYCTL